MYFNQTLRAVAHLILMAFQKEFTYSEFVNKMLQHGIEKSNFPDRPF